MKVRPLLGMIVACAVTVTGALLWSGSAGATPTASIGHARHGAEQLGPTGYRKLRLGMTRPQIVRTHQASVMRGAAGTCRGISLRAHRPGPEQVSGWLSPKHGLVAIYATGPMHTPRGIRIGSTRAQVRAAYPRLRHGVDYWSTPVPGNPKAVYEMLFDGPGPKAKLYELGLLSRVQDCVN